jgi:hypothetical protein
MAPCGKYLPYKTIRATLPSMPSLLVDRAPWGRNAPGL